MSEYAVLDYDRVVRVTDRSVLIVIDDEDTWVPLSVIDGFEVDDWDEPGCLDVAEWWATKEGLV